MNTNIPKRHHYIPQFLLRNFCGKDGKLLYYDKNTQKFSKKKPVEIFQVKNLYRDDINHPDNPIQIENDLGKLENRASKVIKKFLNGTIIEISVAEEETLRIFFAIMAFRSENTRKFFTDEATEDVKGFYKIYQEDGNLTDFWKRNLSIIVECKTINDLLTHPDIDNYIKWFMRRDTIGIFPFYKYFTVVDIKRAERFIITDIYPAITEGVSDDGRSRGDFFSIYPISPTRALLLATNGVEGTRRDVLKLDKRFLVQPSLSPDGKNIKFHAKKLYEQDVRFLNKTMFDLARDGVIFQSEKSLELYI